jgi:serine/threonine protein phosphatase 1
MSTIAIGDIHGHRPALEDLLSKIAGEVTEGDTVVFLGDYIDRGPDSKGCIDAILDFRRAINVEVVCLVGNHEDWFLRTRCNCGAHSWLLGMDGLTTIRSYSAEAERVLRDAVSQAGLSLFQERCELPYEAFFNCLAPEHVRFFESLRLYHQTADCVCAHGGLDPRVARVDEQKRDALIWGAATFPGGYQGAEVVVYGHWDDAALDADGWPAPRVSGNTIGIDTISFGVLTAVRLPDRHVFRSARYEAYV